MPIPDVPLTVHIVDPCITANIEQITFSQSPLKVDKDQTAQFPFTAPRNDVEIAKVSTGWCGAKEYFLTDASTGAALAWASIAGNDLYIDSSIYPDTVLEDISVSIMITTQHVEAPT